MPVKYSVFLFYAKNSRTNVYKVHINTGQLIGYHSVVKLVQKTGRGGGMKNIYSAALYIISTERSLAFQGFLITH